MIPATAQLVIVTSRLLGMEGRKKETKEDSKKKEGRKKERTRITLCGIAPKQ
jgi:hypothetical protein